MVVGVTPCLDLTHFFFSLLSPNCSVKSRDSGDSVGLRNRTCETMFSNLSAVRPAPSLWILG